MISIIIPNYNTEKFIGKCVESILNQTYSEFELILVDDGSKDNTFSELKKYEQIDSRVKAYQNDKNGGAAKARNYGLKKATGDYLMYIDADDYLPKDALEVLYNNIIKYNADISVGGYYKDVEGTITEKKFKFAKKLYNKNSALKHYLSFKTIPGYPWGKLFKRSIVEGISFREDVKLGDDATYVFNALCNANKVCFTTTPVYYYFIRKDSVSAHGGDLNDNELTTLEQLDVIRKYSDKKITEYSKVYEFEMYYIILQKYLKSSSEAKEKYIDFYKKCKKVLKADAGYTLFRSINPRIKIHCIKYYINTLRKVY